MATVRIQNNILEDKVDTFSVDSGTTIEKIIREHTDGHSYDSTMVECYDFETGKTYFAAIESDTATTNAVVQVNGKDVTLDYEVKENDIVGIVITPAGGGGDWDWGAALIGGFTGAITGALYGTSLNAGAGTAIGAILGFVVGFVGGGILSTYLDDLGINGGANKASAGLDTKKLPDVRGAANQPLLDQTYPFVLGKHLTAPFIIGSPWNEIWGTHGENNYIHVLYAVGYAPLRLTDFKLGDMFLAHNQRWSGNQNKKNIFHGELSGIDEGDNIDMSTFQQNTTIDLYHRPLVPAETMRQAGWTEVESGYCTVYSSGYSNQTESTTVLVTPILSDGTVLSPAQLEDYADDILNGTSIPVDILLNTFYGTTSVAQSNVYAEQLHEAQEAYYFGGSIGDIVNTWRNNDVHIEILQQSQNGGLVDYGNVYPYAKIQEDVGANVLYIADGSLVDIARAENISYKGLGLKNGLRNCPIHFTEEFPKSATVELDFANGLYKTRSETANGESQQKNYKIPCWVAIQWRVYSDDNPKADGESSGEIPVPAYNYNTNSYTSTQRGWVTFNVINGTINSTVFTEANRNADLDAHTGNNLFVDPEPNSNSSGSSSSSSSSSDNPAPASVRTYTDINKGWIGSYLFNIEQLGGDDTDTDGLNEFRCVTSVDFVQWAYYNLLTHEEQNSGDETILAKKFKAYFCDDSNSTKSVEVRVVRISPCYLDETVSTKELSAYKFNDIFTWTTLTSEVLDGDKLTAEDPEIVQKRPLTEERMRKLCVVSLKAKTDTVDQLSNTIKKFSCIAQSFAPYYDSSQKKWFPESVKKITKYYKPPVQDQQNPRIWHPGQEITEQQFYQDRQNGIKSIRTPAGNDFISQMVNNVIRINSHIDDRGRYYIPYDDKDQSGNYLEGCDGTLNYCTNIVSSMFLLAGIGPHLGVDALGYEQNFYYQDGTPKSDIGDFNMVSLAKWNEEVKELEDGSYYTSAGYHYNYKGERVVHAAQERVKIFFAANAYIYQPDLLENMLAKISVAGRAVYTRDGKNRLTVIMDKPEKYPVALINQQNTLKSSYTISFAELPSGLQITFPDENDGYMQNDFYCMTDGEDAENPRGAIEQYSFNYVTNPTQQNSLGRYLLANRVLNREVVTKQIGIEGASIGLGNLVLVSDDTMLIGTDNGGRISQLIEDDEKIYGFIINNTFHYTGEEEDVEIDGEVVINPETGEHETQCKQGVLVYQPSQYKESRVITLRLAKKNYSVSVGGKNYRTRKGNTNTVLFATPISKSDHSTDESDYYVYKPEVDNIVSFGIVGQITSTYRVIKIKSDAKHHYEFTLMKYQEDLYDYGRALPSFQNNMTIPDRSGEDSFALSNNVTQTELVKALAESASLAQGKIDETFGNTPPVPTNVTASVKQDCIQVSCAVTSENVNNVDHIIYELKRPDGSTVTIKGSYSTEYYFNRAVDGFPEKSDLRQWQMRAKAVSIYLDQYHHNIEGEWSSYVNITPDSINAYGTWIPPIPNIVLNSAFEDGIDIMWNCDLRNVYGSINFEVTVYYNNSVAGTVTAVDKSATYQFDRAVDGYPEKPGTVGMSVDTKTLDNYHAKVRAKNLTTGVDVDSLTSDCTYAQYKTWIPANPYITARVSNRNVTLTFTQDASCYGEIGYLVGVRSEKDTAGVFYVPDLETNPYSRETAYKLFQNGNYVVGLLETDTQHTQSMPLESQGGSFAALDINESTEDNRVLAVSKDGHTNKIFMLGRGGFAPIDTVYQFECYAFNKTVERYYDSINPPVDHHYDKNTYHKVSTGYDRRFVTALATSVRDVLNGSIISSKIGEGAITETKIENDAITTPKLQTNAVVADKIYTYNMLTLHNGTHAISGYALPADGGNEVKGYISQIKAGNEGPSTQPVIDQLDRYIREHSNNYWLGIDTANPEFYMGNMPVAQKALEGANYFHYYTENGETNLDIKLTNFIVTAVSSTIKGYFNVRNKTGQTKYGGANAFLRVNPETSSSIGDTVDGYMFNDGFYSDRSHDPSKKIMPDSVSVYKDLDSNPYKYYQWNGSAYYEVTPINSETMILKGDLILGNKNSNPNAWGNLYVGGSVSTGSLQVGTDTGSFYGYLGKVFGSFGVSGDSSFLGNLTVGQQNATRTLTVNGALSVTGNTTVGGNTSVTGSLTAGAASFSSLSISGGTVSGDLSIGNSLIVDDDSQTANVQIGALGVDKKAKIYGTLDITNTLTVDTINPHTSDGTISTGNISSYGTITATGISSSGNITATSGSVSAASVSASGNISASGDVSASGRVSGVIHLGSAPAYPQAGDMWLA